MWAETCTSAWPARFTAGQLTQNPDVETTELQLRTWQTLRISHERLSAAVASCLDALSSQPAR